MRVRLVAHYQPVPFKLCEIDYLRAADDCTEAPVVQEVKLEDIIAVQDEVDFETFGNDAAIQKLIDHPVVIKVDKYYILMDGHHRATLAYREGKKAILCYVFDRQNWHIERRSSEYREYKVSIIDVSGYIDSILEMYENASEEQGRIFNMLIGTKDLSYEQYKSKLEAMTDEQLISLDCILNQKFLLDENGLIDL